MAECWPQSVVRAVRAALLGDGGLELLRSSRRIVSASAQGKPVVRDELRQARLVLALDRELDRERVQARGGGGHVGSPGASLTAGNSSRPVGLFTSAPKGVM